VKRYRSMLSIAYLCLSLAAASRAQSQPSSTPAASASIPRLIRFSGNVKDDAGNPRGGVVGITFAL